VAGPIHKKSLAITEKEMLPPLGTPLNIFFKSIRMRKSLLDKKRKSNKQSYFFDLVKNYANKLILWKTSKGIGSFFE